MIGHTSKLNLEIMDLVSMDFLFYGQTSITNYGLVIADFLIIVNIV